MVSLDINENIEIFNKYFYYDETSPSCLRWKISPSNKIEVDSVAGSNKSNKREKYWHVMFNLSDYRVHRIICALFGFYIKDKTVDHIDGNIHNNKIENLRVVDLTVNSRNRKLQKDNKTGVSGVTRGSNGKSGNEYYFSTVRFNKKQRTKCFSISKLGEEKAFQFACEWREKMIKELNENGAGYSERHGT